MPALRCTTCGAKWPIDYDRYRQCPVCEATTWHCTEDPMSQSEANHYEFEHAFWPRWETARLQRERGTIELVAVELPDGQVESD